METAVSFVLAFAVCGALCALAQVLVVFVKLLPPHILNIYMALGGLLTPCGAMDWLAAVGGGGFLCIICGAGNAFEVGAGLACHGMPLMVTAVALLFFSTVTLSLVSGELKYRAMRDEEDM